MTLWKKQKYRNREKDQRLPGVKAGERKRKELTKGILRGDGTTSYFDCGSGYMIMHLSKLIKLYTKTVYFIVH